MAPEHRSSTNATNYKKLDSSKEVKEEEMPVRDTFYDGWPDIERVIPLNYGQLVQEAHRHLFWFRVNCGVYFASLSVLVAATTNGFYLEITIICICLWTMYAYYYYGRQSKQYRSAIPNQHVALTTTGIRYDRHNFPTGSSFHTTTHIPYCDIKHIVRKKNWIIGSCVVIFNKADGWHLVLMGIVDEEEFVETVENRIGTKDTALVASKV